MRAAKKSASVFCARILNDGESDRIGGNARHGSYVNCGWPTRGKIGCYDRAARKRQGDVQRRTTDAEETNRSGECTGGVGNGQRARADFKGAHAAAGGDGVGVERGSTVDIDRAGDCG